MSDGHIYVAEYEGVYCIRLVGDVRLTLCISFDQFIESMFDDPSMQTIVFDLRKAIAIDSTTLGLMAKISISARQQGLGKPVVVAAGEGIVRLLDSMGFEDIFDITLDDNALVTERGEDLPQQVSDESQVKSTVLEAHKILMELNQNNKVRFHELVETLQNKF